MNDRKLIMVHTKSPHFSPQKTPSIEIEIAKKDAKIEVHYLSSCNRQIFPSYKHNENVRHMFTVQNCNISGDNKFSTGKACLFQVVTAYVYC